MGREGTVRTHVVLPAALLHRIDQLVGKRKRSAFIEEAVEERVMRERQRNALEKTAGALKGKLPPEWETPEKAHDWVRRLRATSDERLKRIWGSDDVPPGHDSPH
jgi:predicted transcriptional regulator